MNAMSSNNHDARKHLHIAPMLDVSTPEFHHLIRILTKHAILWTEMVVDETIAFTNNLDEHLAIASPELHPIVCQIGGRSSRYCAEATREVRKYGYQEVNLNVDCPSSRVSGKRQFGAILMSKDHQDTCLDVITAMKEASECELHEGQQTKHQIDINCIGQKSKECANELNVSKQVKSIPISVKTRVGIETSDGQCYDDLEYISDFISQLHRCGCTRFVIHARKCVIGGLTPAQNRLVPPLNYPRFYNLCRRFPQCKFILNGGIPGLLAAKNLCYGCDDYNEDENSSNSNCSNKEETIESISSHRHCHAVPCKVCNVSNGSCTAPNAPQSTPSNLKGCMIGRACMENPSMFWDVDRYFYGMDNNPCQTRRDVLEKYCLYLEKTYPRRCCDNDNERMTLRIPAPNIELPDWGCSICQEYYGCCKDSEVERTITGDRQDINKESKLRISSRVVDRSLKPILGIFFGVKKSKLFRRECDRLSRNKRIRNCGPGYILRKAMSVMPQELLDENFAKTEDLVHVPEHRSPCCIERS